MRRFYDGGSGGGGGIDQWSMVVVVVVSVVLVEVMVVVVVEVEKGLGWLGNTQREYRQKTVMRSDGSDHLTINHVRESIK